MHELRWNRTWTAAIWLSWLLVAAALSVEPLTRHLEKFAEPGVAFQRGILAALLFLPVLATLYVRLRRRGLWRYEPRIAASAALAAALFYQPLGTAAAAAFFIACYAAGKTILEKLSLDGLSTAADLPLATALGFGAWTLVMIPLGLAGGYRDWVFAVGVTVCLVVFRGGLAAGVRSLQALERIWSEDESLASPLVGVTVLFVALFIGCTLAVALVPAIGYDGVSHHLPAARYYLESGQLEPLPGGVFESGRLGVFYSGHSVAYSYYPQSFEILEATLFGLGGQSAARWLNPVVFGLTILLLVAIARRCGLSRAACALGAVAAATLPFLHWVGSIVKNDFLAALFQAGALYAVLAARRGGARNWLFVFAALLGLSFGVKHTALFGAIPLGLLALDELRRRDSAAKIALALAGVFVVCGLFWHARTFALTGNPVYPANTQMVSKTYEPLDKTEAPRWRSLLAYPWLAHFRGSMVLESPTANPLGLFLVFFWPAWLLTRPRVRSPLARKVAFFCVLYFAYWMWIWGLLRYALVPIALVTLFTAARAEALWQASGARMRFAVSAALCASLSFALLPTMLFEINAPQLELLAGRISEEDYLRKAMRDYPALEFLAANASPGDQTLSINNCSSAYAPDPARFLCLRLGRRWLSERSIELAEEALRISEPRWVILPTGRRGQSLAQTLVGEATPLHRDRFFRVYRLPD